MKIWLEDEQGNRSSLAGITSIGRMSACTVVLNTRHVSRRHAVIYSVAEDRHWLVDLGSTNGVRVNSVRLTEPWPLHDGDRVEIGDRVLVFRSHIASRWERRSPDGDTNFQSTVVMPNRSSVRSYGAMMVETNGRMVWQSRRASDWLAAYFPEASGSQLPPGVREWLTQKGPSGGTAVPLAIEQRGRRLVLRAVEENEGRLLVLLTEEEPETGAVLAAKFGLTPREREVMHWLVEGKSNPEIASILGVSPRTVEKHLEVVFNKLGVGNRTAALRAVMEVTGERTP